MSREETTIRFRLGPLLAILLLPGIAASQDLEAARELYASGQIEEATRAFRVAGGELAATDPEGAAAALNNACVLATRLGQLELAREDCLRALELRRELSDLRGQARTSNNLALVEQTLGNYDGAEELYRAARRLNREIEDAEAEAINLLNLGVVANLRGRYGDALALYREAESLAASRGDEPWSAEQGFVARLNTATALEKIGAHDQALAVYLDLAGEASADDPRRRAELDLNLGTAYRNVGDAGEALRSFDRAADFFRDADEVAAWSNALLNRALTLHFNLGDLQAAEEAYRRALTLARQGGDRSEEVQDLFYLGRLLLDDGRTAQARTTLEEGLELARELDSAEGRWSSLAALAEVARAEGRVDLAERRYREALAEIERTRSGLRTSDRIFFFGDRRPVFEGLVALLVGQGRAADALDVVQRTKARDLLDQLGPASAPPSDAAAIQAALGADLLLELLVTAERVFGFVVTADTVRAGDLGAVAPVNEAVLDLHRRLAAGAGPEADDLELLSSTLSAVLETSELSGGRLFVAPDGLLRYLPFELLSAPGDSQALIDDTTLIYVPSGSVLATPRPSADPQLRFLGIAEVDAGHAPGPSLPALPAARREVEAAAKVLGGPAEQLFAAAATERELRSRLEGPGSHVVHFATHAVLDEQEGATALVLAPGAESDGLLRPSEIAGWRTPSDLVVLAACDTALARHGSGRALGSLTGAFLAAGASGVLATLWPVPDGDAAVISDLFYRRLQEGERPAEALRSVKLRLRRDPRWQSPSRWAGWVLIGDAPPLPRTRAALSRNLLLVLVLLAGALLGLLLRATARR